MATPQTVPEKVEGKKVSAPVGPMDQQKRIERMKEYFANRPKETIRIRKDEGDQWVQINGYAFQIQAGKEVKVPVDVADQLRNADII
jgi:hypothetical protein